MYQKKKLALFVSHVYGEYQTNLCQGVIRQAEEYGYRTEIYATNDGEDLGDYSIGEESVLSIPNFSDLDGVIFASGTYYNKNLSEKIRQLLLSQNHARVIEVAEEIQEFPTVSLENNLTAGTLTEHLISVHQAKRIAYLGLGRDNYYSIQRRKAYETVMARHMLPVDDHCIYIIDEEHPLDDAIHFFTEDKTRNLDAVVCYNDEIALSFWRSSYENGFEVPKDFSITGCDNSEPGQNVNPPLTSVTFPAYQLGVAAVNLLMKQEKGKAEKTTTVFAEPIYRGSCGCNYKKREPGFVYDRALASRIENLENSMFTSMKMSATFAHVTDVDDAMDTIEKYISYIDGCNEFYLCLYSDWDTIQNETLELLSSDSDEEFPADDDTMLLKLAVKGQKRLPECSFSKTSLLPDFLQKDSDSSYIVCPLFFENRVFGYVAMAFADNEMNFQFKLVHWVMNITRLLQGLCETKHTQILSKHLEAIYLRDILTGLYNHHGFNQQKELLLQNAKPGSYLSTVLIDLDSLKTINDQFGHQEGDFALSVIGQALSNAITAQDIAARFSGDEFYVLLYSDTRQKGADFIKRVEDYLENFNRLSSKPYLISASAGCNELVVDGNLDSESIDVSFTVADQDMYHTKKNKVKKVLR